MNRKTVWITVAAILAVMAITLSAATLGSTTSGSGVGVGGAGSGIEQDPSDPDGEILGGNSDETGVGQEPGIPFLFEFPCYPVLAEPPVILGLFGLLFLIGGVQTWRHNLGVGVAVMILLFWIVLPVYLFFTGCVAMGLTEDFPSFGGEIGSESEGGRITLPGVTDAATDPTVPELVLLALGGILVLTVVTYWMTGDQDHPGSTEVQSSESKPSPESDVAAVGRAAGRAADRLETGDEFENEVYRAWAEMTTELEVEHPSSSTPSEFALAAVEAGMDREDVDRLTELFEEVRYGGFAPTPEREQEAIETLRRIETEYADGDEGL